MGFRDRLAVLDRALLAGREPSTAATDAVARAPVAPRREPLHPLHRLGRAAAALWWLLADGVLLGLAALLRSLQPLRTLAVGGPVGCAVTGFGISLWWGSWGYAVIGALAGALLAWMVRSEQS